MDTWSPIMYNMIRAFHPISVLYFISAIFIGGFFSLNMIIAVIKIHYSV